MSSDSDSEDFIDLISSDSESADDPDELIFLDLTHNEIVTDIDHKLSNADAAKLARIRESFAQRQLNETDDNIGNTSNVTIRKRNRFNADNHSNGNEPNEVLSGSIGEVVNVSNVTIRKRNRFIADKDSNGKEPSEILTGSIGKILNVSNVTIRKHNRINAVNEPNAKDASEVPTGSHKTGVLSLSSPVRRRLKQVIAELNAKRSFLESLDDSVPVDVADPESLKYRKHFRENKNELVDKLFALYNERVFKNKLNIDIVKSKWCNWGFKKGAAGRCNYQTRHGIHCCNIVLYIRFITSAQRVRDVFLHELCHAAVWIIDGKKEVEGHGDLWQSWTKLAAQAFPEIPHVTVYHDYKSTYEFTYECVICSASSVAHQMFNSDQIFCAFCHGPVEVFRNKEETNGKRTLHSGFFAGFWGVTPHSLK